MRQTLHDLAHPGILITTPWGVVWQSTEKEPALNNATVETRETDQELFFNDVTDETLEAAATAAGAAQSLWGTVTVSGCTCIE
jgi:hypothetical protein